MNFIQLYDSGFVCITYTFGLDGLSINIVNIIMSSSKLHQVQNPFYCAIGWAMRICAVVHRVKNFEEHEFTVALLVWFVLATFDLIKRYSKRCQ